MTWAQLCNVSTVIHVITTQDVCLLQIKTNYPCWCGSWTDGRNLFLNNCGLAWFGTERLFKWDQIIFPLPPGWDGVPEHILLLWQATLQGFEPWALSRRKERWKEGDTRLKHATYFAVWCDSIYVVYLFPSSFVWRLGRGPYVEASNAKREGER